VRSVNIDNAVVYGLHTDLKLKGNEFNVALTDFFVPYVIFETPLNIFLKLLRPHVWCEFARDDVAAYPDKGLSSVGMHVPIRPRHDASRSRANL